MDFTSKLNMITAKCELCKKPFEKLEILTHQRICYDCVEKEDNEREKTELETRRRKLKIISERRRQSPGNILKAIQCSDLLLRSDPVPTLRNFDFSVCDKSYDVKKIRSLIHQRYNFGLFSVPAKSGSGVGIGKSHLTAGILHEWCCMYPKKEIGSALFVPCRALTWERLWELQKVDIKIIGLDEIPVTPSRMMIEFSNLVHTWLESGVQIIMNGNLESGKINELTEKLGSAVWDRFKSQSIRLKFIGKSRR